MTKTVSHWIGGKSVEGTSGKYGPVTDPATGAVTTRSPSPPQTRWTPRSPPRRPRTRPGARPPSPPAPRSCSATEPCWTPTATRSRR
ncbi:hypothetical protein NKH18_17580 [Streptomyces sp. M10(2022)]